ncbi:MAG TPA: carboxymuconolactone decarboxylase family protein [Acidimicrobiales bacterium]
MKNGGNHDAEDGTHYDVPAHWPAPVPERRVAPVAPEERTPEVDELLETLRIQPDQPVANIFATLAHHPRLLKRWSAMGGVLLFAGELHPRDRELLILRTAWNCRAHYEWGHHVPMGKAAGLNDDEIARIPGGAEADGWSDADATLLRAADELHNDARLSDGVWTQLAERFGPAQLIELCMLVGQYHLVAFTLNSLGVQLEN